MTYDLIVIGSGPGRLLGGGARRPVRPEDRNRRKRPQTRRHLPARRLHPDQGAAPYGRLVGALREPRRRGHLRAKIRELDYAKVLDRKNKIVSKHAKGVEFLMKKNKVDWVKGYATILPRSGSGPLQVEVKSETGSPNTRDQECHHRHRLGSAHASRIGAGREDDPDQHRDPGSSRHPQDHADHRRGRGGRGVRIHLQSLRDQGHGARNAAAPGAGGRRRDFQGTGALFQEDRHPLRDRRQGREHHSHRERRAVVRRARERKARGPGGRDAAGGRGPQAEHRKYRSRQAEGGAGSRLHQGG